MSFLARLFQTEPDPREAWRPLWHAVVAEARDPEWYRGCGVADSVEGRFDMITLVLAAVLIRMESEPELVPATALVTELFVEDMEGQLREQGIGDPVVGKRVGRLMGTMGGRLGAYRKALEADRAALAEVVRRNVTLAEADKAEAVAATMQELAARLARTGGDALRAGRIAA